MSSCPDFGFLSNEEWSDTQENDKLSRMRSVSGKGTRSFWIWSIFVFSSLAVIGDNITASFQI